MEKKWYESKTIWFNLIVVALSIIAFVLTGIQSGELPLGWDAETVAFALGIINLVLRFITRSPLR